MGASAVPAVSGPLYRRGDLVIAPFPFSAATGFKNRPALVLAALPLTGIGVDYLVCMVTSQASVSGADSNSLPVLPTDVTGGVLSAAQSFLRPAYLFTLTERKIVARIGFLRPDLTDMAGAIVVRIVSGP